MISWQFEFDNWRIAIETDDRRFVTHIFFNTRLSLNDHYFIIIYHLFKKFGTCMHLIERFLESRYTLASILERDSSSKKKLHLTVHPKMRI